MLSVSQAQAIILQQARPLPPETVPLSSAALGLVLAEDVVSDLDMPPYDKALMDGYAVRSADLPEGRGVLNVIEEITAGQTPRRPLGPGQAARIMTGAPLPAGADAVVIVERTRLLEGGRVQVEDRPPRPGQNVLPRGQEMRPGETVLVAGTVLRPQEFGVLATVGRTAVRVHPAPRVAILSTGDEVVEAAQTPGPGQIRNSNGPMLVAQAARAGGLPRYLGIARDHLDSLRPLVAEGLRYPILVLSGGVSAGKLDLVPGVLQELGVEAHFHKVEMKPGKPVFFGTGVRGQGSGVRKEALGSLLTPDPGPLAPLVFGLPGNPVSALVCFELFVRPAIRRLAGHAEAGPPMVQAVLAEDFAYRTDRPTYHPARLELTASGWRVRPVPWFGSPDLRGLTRANAFVLLPPGDHQHRAGQSFPVLRTDSDL
ncbi:MAG TPA: gephyrin-like molybdotransferase Glp [Gemmataceae bacterium]|nr:gephyrin-like molybdotransferase Glp [Gemmataceae bacterium]